MLTSSRRLPQALAAFVLLGGAPAGLADSTVVFNEIHYHPPANEALLEWLEVHNQNAVDTDISGWSLSRGVQYTFPEGTVIPGGGYLVVAASPATLEGAAGITGVHGPFAGRLDNSGEWLELRDQNFRLMDAVRYRDEGEWPVAADGSGLTLAKVDPQSASEPGGNWAVSREMGGTPGAANFSSRTDPGLPAGLVSYWPFDGSGSTARDVTGRNDGSLGTGATRVPGLVGPGAVSFDNTANAFVNVGSGSGDSFATTTGITLEAVVRPGWSGAASDYDDIFRKEDGSNRILLAFQNDGNAAARDVPITPVAQPVLSFGLNVGGAYSELDMPLDGQEGRPALADLEDGRAHHVAASYTSATGLKALYVDGALVFSAGLGAGKSIASGGGSTAYIGNMSGRGEPFTGVIDEVAFWSRALGASEVAAHAQAVQAGRGYLESAGTDGVLPRLRINELSSGGGSGAWLELLNLSAGPVELEGFAITSTGLAGGEYLFGRGSLSAGGYLVLEAPELGFDLIPGNKLFVYPPGRAAVVEAVEVKEGLRGRYPDGTGEWLWPDAATPGAPNSVTLRDEVVINEIMYHHRPLPARPPVTEETVLVALEAAWRYDDSGAVPAGWEAPGFDDSGWPAGPALLYHEENTLPAPKRTELELGAMAFYFRHRFEFAGDPAGTDLVLRPIVDDGAVFYLNGQEILRLNMPAGSVGPTTPAQTGVSDAAFSGPFTVPASAVVRGTNVLAVEVHQATAGSSDVVFGLELAGAVLLEPGRPFQESPEAWVELTNRSGATVDLSGWSLDQGIAFAFPPGTLLGPGEYLVVAADRVLLGGLFPEARITGDFTGRLSHRSDRIRLRDERGNPVDEVRYFDGVPWPEYADGGGSSLELRDPWADNGRPGAWAASDESLRSPWRTYSYREIARANIGPTQWREFVLGLLDAGEALLDDVSVLEDPDGAAVELVEDGSFEAGTAGWRIIGNHRHSRVVTDPDDPGNRVLHLVATGATEHMHNHAETTLTGGRSVVNGREYQVSFRARWLAGSNQLHTRLYFNRVVRTTLLEVPALNGTPGAPNSTLLENLGPTFEGLAHEPAVPAPGETVAVSVAASDPDTIRAATLWYSVSEGPWQSAPMAAGAGGSFRAEIPGQAAGRVVQFYVEAEDLVGARSTAPAGGRDSRALFQVDDGRGDLADKHNLRLIMIASDVSFLHARIQVMSNDRLGATVVYDEREVFYDAGVRLKGSERGRDQPGRVGFNISFPRDHLFRGVHEGVAIDRSGGYSVGTSNGQDEILVKHMINRAGGLPTLYDDLVLFISPRTTHTGPALLQMARHNDLFLDSQYLGGSEGTVFEFELIYYPLTTDASGYKLPEPDNVMGVDLEDHGDDKEVYRWNFLIGNNRARDDYESLIPFLKAMSLSGSALEGRIPDLLDVDETMRTFAMMALCGIGDVYTFGNNHNVRLYVRPEDGRVVFFPWDWDFAFVQSSSAGLWGNQNIVKVITRPPFQHLFYGHVLDIIDKTYNPGYMARWTDHYGRLAAESYGVFLNYITQRRVNALTRLPAAVAFEITTQGGADFTVDEGTVALEGRGWIDVRSILIVELEQVFEPFWPAVTSWSLAQVPLAPGRNPLTLLALDRDGNVVGSDSITVTSTFDPPVPVLAVLVPDRGVPGSEVILQGSGFLPGLEVSFGAQRAARVEVAAADQAVVEVPPLGAGAVQVTARNRSGGVSNALGFTVLEPPERFVRGDANLDGAADLADAVRVLAHLFRGAALGCEDAADADDTERLELTDAVYLLIFLFRGGPAPRPPYPEAGEDPGGAALGCEDGL